MGQGAPFSHARVSNEVAAQWMSRTRVLHDNVQDARGQLTKVPKHPVDSVPAPDENILREVLGACHGYQDGSVGSFYDERNASWIVFPRSRCFGQPT